MSDYFQGHRSMATSIYVCLTLKTTRFLNEKKVKFSAIFKQFVFSTSFPKNVPMWLLHI